MPQLLGMWRKIMSAKSALNDTGQGAFETRGMGRELVAFIVGSAGIASGAVQMEEAHDPNYAGTWAAIGSAVTVAASTVKTVRITGVTGYVRARISTVLAGGTVDVYLGKE